MSPEARRHLARVEEELSAARLHIERAFEAAKVLGGARRPRLHEIRALLGNEIEGARIALQTDTVEVYVVCGRERPVGARCTRPAGHPGECEADYSAHYHLGPQRARKGAR